MSDYSIGNACRLLLLAMVFLVALPSTALACDCRATGEGVSLAGFDSVFRGVVLAEYLLLDEQGSAGPKSVAVFQVLEAWKGVEVPITIVFGGLGPDCGSRFEKDVEYVVFARRTKGGWEGFPNELYSSACSPTAAAAVALATLEALGKGSTARFSWKTLGDSR